MLRTDDQITAREAQVLGAPLRIAALPLEALPPEVEALACSLGESLGMAGSNDLPTYFRVVARHLGVTRCQLATGLELFRHGALPAPERELAILRTGWLCGAPYEWSEHVAIGIKVGLSAGDIARVRQGSADPGWCRHRRALLAAVEELIADHMIIDETWAVLAETWDERQLIELPALVGQYVSVAMIQNSLRMPLGTDARGLRAL